MQHQQKQALLQAFCRKKFDSLGTSSVVFLKIKQALKVLRLLTSLVVL